MNDLIRIRILDFLQWNDKNGYYTDEICDLENIPCLTIEDGIKFFFCVINSDFYYTIVDNIFELNFDEIIQYSREYGFYEKNCKKLNLLISNNNPNKDFYKSLIE